MAKKKEMIEEPLEQQPEVKAKRITTNEIQPQELPKSEKLKTLTTNNLELRKYDFPESPVFPNVPNLEPRETKKVEGVLTDANMEARLEAVRKKVRPGSLSARTRKKR